MIAATYRYGQIQMTNGQLWKKLEKNVLNIQKRIYKATKAGKIGKAKNLARLFIKLQKLENRQSKKFSPPIIEKHKFNYFKCQTSNPR